MTLTQPTTPICKECEFFLYPEPSNFYPDVIITRYCPHSAHRVATGGWATGGMKACSHFKKAEQLTIAF